MIGRLARRILRPPAACVIVAVPAAAAAAELAGYDDPGMPPHVTVLWPFVRRVRARDAATLAGIAAEHDAFEFRLGEVREFPGGVTYLAPEPAGRFVALTDAVAAAWRLRPYGGEFAEVIPHVTVRTGRPLDGATRARLDALLPITAYAEELQVLVPRRGRWRLAYSVPLRRPASSA